MQELLEAIDKGNCAPICVRLAWHDAGTFDKAKADKPFPQVRPLQVRPSRRCRSTLPMPSWRARGYRCF
jgi:hypothetical protein